jgi:N-acetylglutamate synthase-like GNAT family acetyltransferase
MHCCWRQGEFEISTDSGKADLVLVHEFLTNSYWAKGIPLDTVARSIQNSLCFGIYEHSSGKQVGFARVISDQATFAYLADVFVIEAYRGKGLSKWMMACIKSHPQLQGLRRWLLATSDAHGLYAQFGFGALKTPGKWMEIHDPGVYS